MKYYTLKEVAVLLGVTHDQVFEMTTGRNEPILWPSAYFATAVSVSRLVQDDTKGAAYGWGVKHTPVEEEVTGYYSVTPFGGSPLLQWNEYNRAKVGVLTKDGLKYYVIGDRSIHKNDLRISSNSLALFMEEIGIPVPEDIHNKSPKQNDCIEKYVTQSNNIKGGRHKSLLSEAIEFIFIKYRNEGNTEILRPGKIREFMKRLKEFADEKNNRNFLIYVADRIESVKILPSKCTVTTKEQFIKSNERRDSVIKSCTYSQQEVSKKLTELRKKYPL